MREELLHNARLLIVDDQQSNVRLLERILQQAGYTSIQGTTRPTDVLALYTEFQPDLILLDLHMPLMDGFAVMEALGAHISDRIYLPILVISADITPEAKLRALSAGA